MDGVFYAFGSQFKAVGDRPDGGGAVRPPVRLLAGGGADPAGRPGDSVPRDCQLGQPGRPGPEAPGAGRGALGHGGVLSPGGQPGGGPGGPLRPPGGAGPDGAGDGGGGRVRLPGDRLPGEVLVPHQGVRRLRPPRRGVHRPAGGHRRGGGAELVVRGLPAPVPGGGLRHGGGRRRRGVLLGRPGRPHHRGGPGLCAEIQIHGAAGAAAGVPVLMTEKRRPQGSIS